MFDELVDAVMRRTSGGPGPFATEIADLTLIRSDRETHPNHLILKPGLCVVVQGGKRTAFGDTRFEYRAGQALAVSVEMPAMGRVIEASHAKPFLGLVLEFDLGVMHEVMRQLVAPPTLN